MHLSNKSNNLTPVEINSCWREACSHARQHSTLVEKFDFNPKNLPVVSNKVNTVRLGKENCEQKKELQDKLAQT